MVDEQTPAIAPWGQWDRIALQLLFAGGLVYSVLVFLFGAFLIVVDLVTGTRTLTLYVTEELQANPGAAATLVAGTLDSATVFVSGLSGTASTLLTIGSSLALVSHLFVALAFAYLVWRLLRREPFLRSLTRAFNAAGVVLLVGSLIAQAATGIGNNLAAAELGIEVGYNRIWPLPLQLDVWPLAVGFMLTLVGIALEYAQKLSAETRGLV